MRRSSTVCDNLKVQLIYLIFLSIAYSLNAADYNFFWFNGNSGIDYYTGRNLSNVSNEDIVYNSDILSNVRITTKSTNSINSTNNTIYTYLDGKIISINSNNRDGRNTIYSYSSNGYLESFDFQKRLYPQDNICLLYEDDILIYRITIYENDNYKKIIFEKPVKDSNDFYLSQTFEYFYKEKQLQKYIETYSNIKGVVYSIWLHDFVYENNLLILHTIKSNGELRWSYNLSYDKDNNLIQVLYDDYKVTDNKRKIIFSRFDSYGNWLSKMEYYNDKLMYEINRIIEYQE